MLKNKIILISILGLSIAGLFSSCSDFLDVLPDNRTEIDSKVKAKELLVSAYPQASLTLMNELMSDNVKDNGPRFTYLNKVVEDAYYWREATEEGQDSPTFLWSYCYNAIASTNYVLDYCNTYGSETNNVDAIRGEALICRAYSHFLLAINFCQQYYPGSKDLGIPYIDNTNVKIEDVPLRGTISETFDRINADIEAALPLIDDNNYADGVIKYHFNKKAAHAFAARFNLYKGDYDKVIKYANVALGSDPASVLRNFDDYSALRDPDALGSEWVRSNSPCNLLLVQVASTWPYEYMGYDRWYRYAHNQEASNEGTMYAPGPWGSRKNLKYTFWGGNEIIMIPKLRMFFEILDPIAQTGYPHIILTAFTTDETLLTRAEAYALKKDYPNALKDLKVWYNARTANAPELTEDLIRGFYRHNGGANEYTIPTLNPKFEVTADQLPFIYCVLQCRRLDTLHEGLRWFDVKRYGIEVVHPFTDAPSIVLGPNDLRRAIQIPGGVISAGLEANPR